MAPGMEGRCKRCYLRLEHCRCALIEPIQTQTRFVILRHRLESFKSTNSARWAALALGQCDILTYDGKGSVELEPLLNSGAHLLFPEDAGLEAPAVPRTRPHTLVVLDGTWRQVRRMLNRMPLLRTLQRFSLSTQLPARPRLRSRSRPLELSTFEAIALAVGELEGASYEQQLFSLHAQLVDGTRRGRGTHKRPVEPP